MMIAPLSKWSGMGAEEIEKKNLEALVKENKLFLGGVLGKKIISKILDI